MSRRSLRPQLNQIRAWARQGRTDAWIAHQLEVTVQQIQAFKREHGLEGGTNGDEREDEIDLRAEDDALIAAELEAAAAAAEAAAEDDEDEDEDVDSGVTGDEPAATGSGRSRGRRSRSRGRRGGTRRPASAGPLEATFDHGEEGYGLWLDPAVQDDPVYAEHWAGHRPVEVTIEEDQIVIRRAGGGDDDEDDGE
jgi:hypothetical protein